MLIVDKHCSDITNNKATNFASSVGGSSGAESIAKMLKQHFEALYNSNADSRRSLVVVV